MRNLRFRAIGLSARLKIAEPNAIGIEAGGILTAVG
jgi:hypothetical protein